MNAEQSMVLGIIVILVGLFIWGKWRYDLVALSGMLALVVLRIVPADEALSGFSHPAVITVAAVLIISQGLRNSGLVDLLGRWIFPLTKTTTGHVAVMTGLMIVCSAFMNNVGALALLLPVALSTAAKRNRSPSILLMPIAFGSMLGGMVTLIGTPPNIIIANYHKDVSDNAFGMFDFAPVGLVVAFSGLLFISFVGWRLLPQRKKAKKDDVGQFEIGNYICEIRIQAGSPLIHKTLGDIQEVSRNEITAIGFIHEKGPINQPFFHQVLQENDIIVIKTDPSRLKELTKKHGFELISAAAKPLQTLSTGDMKLVETLVNQSSPLEGRTARYLRRRSGGALSLLALARHGTSHMTRLRNFRFQAGDLLLLNGPKEALDEAFSDLRLVPLAPRNLNIQQPLHLGAALLIFLVALGLNVAGILPVAFAFGLAILGYVAIGLIRPRDLYSEIDWPVIVLLAGLVPLGLAMSRTGLSEVLAQSLLTVTRDLPAWVPLTLLMVTTMTLSDLMNNAATALIMAPISVGLATELQVSVDPFLMAVAIGASCAFLTPVGHQSNTLVMEPGGYRFKDYWRMGLPLEALIVVVSVPALLYFWPL